MSFTKEQISVLLIANFIWNTLIFYTHYAPDPDFSFMVALVASPIFGLIATFAGVICFMVTSKDNSWILVILQPGLSMIILQILGLVF